MRTMWPLPAATLIVAVVRQHAVQGNVVVAARVHDFDLVAHAEAVFHIHARPAVFDADHIAHVLAAVGLGCAAHIVLVRLRVVALVEAVRVATVGQTLQLAQQADIERTTGHRIVNRAAVHLRRAGRIVQRLGTAFDFERIDAYLDQTLDVLDGAQIFRVHDVGAVLVFDNRHQLARTLGFFDQIRTVGQRVARC
jgi:hypothetical protein